MRVFGLTLALVAVVVATPLSAQSQGRNRGRGLGDCRFERTVDAAGNVVFLRVVGERSKGCKFRQRDENVLFENALDRSGNRIFVRRIRDANGRLVIQRVRRNPDGTLVVVSSRVVARERDDDDREFARIRRDDDDDHRGRGRGHDDDHHGDDRHGGHGRH